MGQDKTLISAIGAVSSNGAIGLNGWLPWDIPEELAYFEKTVAGAALVIGRLTYESMDVVPEDSFVVTHQADLVLRPGCTRVASVEEGLQRALVTGKPVFVIGGASLYAAAWPYCDRFYLTRIEQPYAGEYRWMNGRWSTSRSRRCVKTAAGRMWCVVSSNIPRQTPVPCRRVFAIQSPHEQNGHSIAPTANNNTWIQRRISVAVTGINSGSP